MVNYVDYITLKNQWIDTEYNFVNDWDSLEARLNAGYIQGSNVTLINPPTTNENPFCMKMTSSNVSGVYCTFSEERNGSYHFGLSGGIHTEDTLHLIATQDDTETYIKSMSQRMFDNREGITQPTVERYKVYKGRSGEPSEMFYIFKDGRIYFGDYVNFGPKNTFRFGYFKLIKDNNIECYIRACLDENGKPAVYDELNLKYIPIQGISDSMIKTVVMSGGWQELPITDGIEKDKISNRIIEVNKYVDGYAGKYDEICITADEDNIEGVMVSDYTEDKQSHVMGMSDFIELKPRGMLVLPRNRQITALNKPLVKGHKGDIIRIVVR